MQGVSDLSKIPFELARKEGQRVSGSHDGGFDIMLSTPIYQLKRRAKAMAREEAIPLHSAQDRVAAFGD